MLSKREGFCLSQWRIQLELEVKWAFLLLYFYLSLDLGTHWGKDEFTQWTPGPHTPLAALMEPTSYLVKCKRKKEHPRKRAGWDMHLVASWIQTRSTGICHAYAQSRLGTEKTRRKRPALSHSISGPHPFGNVDQWMSGPPHLINPLMCKGGENWQYLLQTSFLLGWSLHGNKRTRGWNPH